MKNIQCNQFSLGIYTCVYKNLRKFKWFLSTLHFIRVKIFVRKYIYVNFISFQGISGTAKNIVKVATDEHDQKGLTGAVGGVLRQIPPTIVQPIILASAATSNVLGGMRNQLKPDAKREDEEKWRVQEDVSGSVWPLTPPHIKICDRFPHWL